MHRDTQHGLWSSLVIMPSKSLALLLLLLNEASFAVETRPVSMFLLANPMEVCGKPCALGVTIHKCTRALGRIQSCPRRST